MTSSTMLVAPEMLLVFGGAMWFAWSQAKKMERDLAAGRDRPRTD